MEGTVAFVVGDKVLRRPLAQPSTLRTVMKGVGKYISIDSELFFHVEKHFFFKHRRLQVIGTAENIWFGENSILTDKEMPLPIVIAVNSVETVSLSRKRFWKILRHFPREKKHYINLFQERVREGVIGEQAIVGSAEMRGEIGGQAVIRAVCMIRAGGG